MKSRLGMMGRSAVFASAPLLIALATGIWLARSAMETKEEKADLSRIENLSSQTRLLTEAVQENINVLRARALDFQQLHTLSPQLTPQNPILHWAELEIKDGRITNVRQAVKNPAWKGHADYYLRSAIEQLGMNEINERGLTALRIREDTLRAREWLAFAFKSPTPAPSVVLALVDPEEAFSLFKRLTHVRSTHARAYLIGSGGQVLNHSQPSYVSNDFSNTPIFTDGIRSIFQGTRLAGAGNFIAIDQLQVHAAYERLGALPIAVVLEQPEETPQTALEKRFEGQVLAAIGILILLSLITARRRKPVQPTTNRKQTGTVTETETVPTTENSQPKTDSITLSPTGQIIPPTVREAVNPEMQDLLNARLLATESALRSSRDESLLVAKFEAEAARLKDPKKIGARLAATASQLCQSPVLFFTYQESLRAGILVADAGFAAGQEPASLTFPISDELMRQIVRSQRETDAAFSLANYPPLAHVLLSKLGVAHYEAWVITGYGHLGRQAGVARVLGFLVVLQAGIESMTRFESVNRMMRATGLIYENALLSQ